MLRRRLQTSHVEMGGQNERRVCREIKKAKDRDEQLGPEDVFSSMPLSEGLKMLVSTMMTGHDDGNHVDGPFEMARKTGREAYFCDWSPGKETRFHCFFERHGLLFDRIRRRREQRSSLLEKARKLRLERNRVCGEFETMLGSCLGEGIVVTGCAKMHPLREYEKRIVSGLETTRPGCRCGLRSF